VIRALTAMVTGSVDLLEAEGRLARVHLVRLGALVTIFMGCGLVMSAAVIAFGAGVVVMLADRVGLGQALLWTGAIGVMLAVGVAFAAWTGYRSGEVV